MPPPPCALARYEAFFAVAYIILVGVYNLEGVSHQTAKHGCGRHDPQECTVEARSRVALADAPACKVTARLRQTAPWWSRHLVGWPFVLDPTTKEHCTHCTYQHITTFGQKAVRPTCVLDKLDSVKFAADVGSAVWANVGKGLARAGASAAKCGAGGGGPIAAAACAAGSTALTAWDVASDVMTQPRTVDWVVLAILASALLLRKMPTVPARVSVLWACVAAGGAALVLDPLNEASVAMIAVGALVVGIYAAGTPPTFAEVDWHYNPYGWRGRVHVLVVWLLSYGVWQSCESYERMLSATYTERLLDSVRGVWNAIATAIESAFATIAAATAAPKQESLISDPSRSVFSHLTTEERLKRLTNTNTTFSLKYDNRYDEPYLEVVEEDLGQGGKKKDHKRYRIPAVCTMAMHKKAGAPRRRVPYYMELKQVAASATHTELEFQLKRKDGKSLNSADTNTNRQYPTPAWDAVQVGGSVYKIAEGHPIVALFQGVKRYSDIHLHIKITVDNHGDGEPKPSMPSTTLSYWNLDGDADGVGRPQVNTDTGPDPIKDDPVLRCALCEAEAAVRRDTLARDGRALSRTMAWDATEAYGTYDGYCAGVRAANERAFLAPQGSVAPPP